MRKGKRKKLKLIDLNVKKNWMRNFKRKRKKKNEF